MLEHILGVPEGLDLKQSVVVLAPVSPHPVAGVTARPVDVLGEGELGPVEVVLHPQDFLYKLSRAVVG